MTAVIKDLVAAGTAIRQAQLAHQDAMRATAEQLGTARRKAAEQPAPEQAGQAAGQ